MANGRVWRSFLLGEAHASLAPTTKIRRGRETPAPCVASGNAKRRPSMSTNIGEGEISPKVTIFAGVGAIAGAILGGAVLGFPALIASTVVFGLAGGVLGAFF
jgi:hypothetical protein